MKAEPFFIINNEVKKNVISRIMDIEPEDKLKVTVSGAGSKTSRQQALDWKWDFEIFKSGIGWHDDTVTMTHARSKWLFARHILLRESELFKAIHDHFMTIHGKDHKKCLEFAEHYISTQSMSVSQVSEYMSDKQRFWTEKGVNLTCPDDYGLVYQNGR